MTEYNTYFHRVYFSFTYLLFTIFKSGFTPRTAEQPLRDRELQEKKQTKRLKHTGNLLRKNRQLKSVC